MADEDADLEVRVTTTSDNSGVDSATEAVGGFTESAHSAAHEMREFTGSTREGQEAIRGIEAAFRGGAAGIGEMIRGLRALTLIVAHLVEESGPLGILLVLVGTIGGAMLAFSRHTKEAAGALDETSKKMDELKKAVAAASKAVEEDFKGMTDAAKDLESEYEKLDKMENASSSRDQSLTDARRRLADAKLDSEEQGAVGQAESHSQQLSRRAKILKGVAESAVNSDADPNAISDANAVADAAAREAESAKDKIQQVKDDFEAKRKVAKLNNESEDSENAVLLAGSKAERAEQESGRLSQIELGAEAKQRQLEATAKDLTGKAIRGQIPSKDAFAAQVAAKTGRAELDKLQGKISDDRTKVESTQSAFGDAKDLDEINQERIELQKQTVGKKENEEAAKASSHLAEQAEKAAAALAKIANKDTADEKKEANADAKTDAQEAKADAKERTKYMSEVHKEMSKETEAVMKLHETSKKGSTAALHALRGTRLIDRQLVNETSYQSSP